MIAEKAAVIERLMDVNESLRERLKSELGATERLTLTQARAEVENAPHSRRSAAISSRASTLGFGHGSDMVQNCSAALSSRASKLGFGCAMNVESSAVDYIQSRALNSLKRRPQL